MDSPPSDSPGDDAQLRVLADEVRAELAAAGLPVLPPDHRCGATSSSGVEVEIDEGVWVSWHLETPLSRAWLRAMMVGAYRPDRSQSHPAIRHWEAVCDALNDAIASILKALGYGVWRNVNDLAPEMMVITPREPGPHWRDPAVPPLAGMAGYAPGVRVRLLAGDFAGSVTTVVSAAYQRLQEGPSRYRVEHPDGVGELDVAPQDVTLAEDDEDR